MILIPELMKLGGAAITPMVKNIAAKLAEQKRGVAILVALRLRPPRSGPTSPTYPETTKAVSEQLAAMQAGTSYRADCARQPL